jgi:hypothetical protein
MVASCIACDAAFRGYWWYHQPYSIETAKRILGRHDGFVTSGLFVDYLERATNHISIACGRMGGKASGLYTPFATALARVEAQRWQELEVAA